MPNSNDRNKNENSKNKILVVPEKLRQPTYTIASEHNSNNNTSDDSTSKEENKKKNYVFYETYTSKHNPFNFESVKLHDGLIFFIGAIILPFLINILVTYLHPIARYPSGSSSQSPQWLQQRLYLDLVSWGASIIVLIYLWCVYGKKFFHMGGLAFFGMSLFMPLLTILFQLLFAKFSSDDLVFSTLSQMIAELITIVFLFATTKNLFKRTIKVFKDGWVLYLVIIIGVLAVFIADWLFGLIKSITTSQNNSYNDSSANQDELEKLLKTVGTTIMLGFFTIFLAPFTEELTTRFGIYLLSGNKWLGLMASTIYFAGMHVNEYGDWTSILDYIGVSFVLASVFLVANGNVSYTISIHMIINIIAYGTMVYGHYHPK